MKNSFWFGNDLISLERLILFPAEQNLSSKQQFKTKKPLGQDFRLLQCVGESSDSRFFKLSKIANVKTITAIITLPCLRFLCWKRNLEQV